MYKRNYGTRSEFGQVGRDYAGRYRNRVKPATAQENVDSIARRMDTLIGMLAEQRISEPGNLAAIESLESQVAFQKQCLDRAEARVKAGAH